jgi:cytidylate kinase
MYRLITISGLSYTGTTTFASTLADALHWKFVSAGGRFREFCGQQGIAITAIPDDVHAHFDDVIRSELATYRRAVYEGRYLAYFAQQYHDVLKVRLDASQAVRVARCLQREPDILSANQARGHILVRDSREAQVAQRLYGLANFLDNSLFNLILPNNCQADMSSGVQQIHGLVSVP